MSKPRFSKNSDKKSVLRNNDNESSTFDANSRSSYSVQQREMEALKAIYMDDFQHLKNESNHINGYSITISTEPFTKDIEYSELQLVLGIYYTKDYPQSSPNVDILSKRNINASQLESIKSLIQTKIQSLLGQEMIYDIIEVVREWILSVGKKKTTFYEKMVQRLEHDEKEQEQKRIHESKLLQIERMKQMKVLEQTIQHDLHIKETMLDKEAQSSDQEQISYRNDHVNETIAPLSLPYTLHFTKPIIIQTFDIHSIIFQSHISPGQWKALAISNNSQPISVIAYEFVLNSKLSQKWKTKLDSLIEEIRKYHTIQSSFAIPIHGAYLDEHTNRLFVFEEDANCLSLSSILQICGMLPIDMVKAYMKQALQALTWLHTMNFIVKNIHSNSTFIQTPHVRYSHIGYQRKIITDFYLKQSKLIQLIPDSFIWISQPTSSPWIPPEISQRPDVYGRKADVWALGILGLEMIYGKKQQSEPLIESFIRQCILFNASVTDNTRDNEVIWRKRISMCSMSPTCSKFFRRIFNQDPSLRPTAQDLLYDPFFHSDDSGWMLVNTPILRDSRLQHSRYYSDFEEVEFLGRGGFGQVVKVRNRIDNRYYAVKRIKLTPDNIEINKRILREVTAISRLHHEYIVRYYQAWIEGVEDDSDEHSDKQVKFALESSSIMNQDVIEFDHNDMSMSSQDSTDEMNDTDASDQGHQQYLYIQMEYCPNKTLRNIIDEGLLDEKEIWRLFRQILEGLAHIHEKGMIHRDLKPSNVFMDENDNVKIGDFGLSTEMNNRITQLESDINYEHLKPTVHSISESFTCGVGTPVYVAPELDKPNSRYNQRVDMYSLGIILFEMLYGPMNTAMERASVLKDIRKKDILFPSDWKHEKYQKQTSLLKLLLNHNDRPNSKEVLLMNDLIPPKLEEDQVQESIHMIVRPNTPYYRKLLAALFKTLNDPHKEYTFDYNTQEIQNNKMIPIMSKLREVLTRISKIHGAIEFVTPVALLPMTPLINEIIAENEKGITMLNMDGQLVGLPFDSILPFARYISRNTIAAHKEMKRYCIDRIFQSNPTGDQPLQYNHCSFDIVSRDSSSYDDNDNEIKRLFEEVQVMKHACDTVIEMLHGNINGLLLRVNHSYISDLVLKFCSIKDDIVHHLYPSYDMPIWKKLMKHIKQHEKIIPSKNLETLYSFITLQGNYSNVMTKLKSMLKNQDIIPNRIESKLSSLFQLLSFSTSLKDKIIFVPMLRHHPKIYYSESILFDIVLEDNWLESSNRHKQKIFVLAQGGRYDSLLDRLKMPSMVPSVIFNHAVGVTFYSTPICLISSMTAHEYKDMTNRIRSDICFIIFGKHLSIESFKNISDLWNNGSFSVNWAIFEDETLLDDAISYCKQNYIGWMMYMKEHHYKGGGRGLVFRLWNLEKKMEMEFGWKDLLTFISSNVPLISSNQHGIQPGHHVSPLIAGIGSIDTFSQPTEVQCIPLENGTTSSSMGNNISVTILHKEKSKYFQRSAHDKASKYLTNLLQQIHHPKQPFELLVYDLPLELHDEIWRKNMHNEDAFKNVANHWSEYLEVLQKLKSCLNLLKSKKTLFIFCFNMKADLLSFHVIK